MCEKCKEAFDIIKKRFNATDEETMNILWEQTAYPVADGEHVLGQAKELVASGERVEP